jgi:hypothetical protein
LSREFRCKLLNLHACRLSKSDQTGGGPDHPAHVIALCPNCHRRVHFGADGHTYNATLIAVMFTIEPEASAS